ncbi:unnamed protein product [Staurois parvus]|uniref:Uncharacterized protein n=1 Tax=Staurois parvus TaxID=386267 RepID=A0ABN9F7T7_9NEOB|nr:unnamed protein product [Staurois parvus]
MGPPGNRRSWGPCVLDQTQKSLQRLAFECSTPPLHVCAAFVVTMKQQEQKGSTGAD